MQEVKSRFRLQINAGNVTVIHAQTSYMEDHQTARIRAGIPYIFYHLHIRGRWNHVHRQIRAGQH